MNELAEKRWGDDPTGAGLSASDSMWTARNGAHQRLVEIFHGLNEMRLAEDEVGGVRLDDGYHGKFYGCVPAGWAT